MTTMPPGTSRHKTFDVELELADGAAAVTSTAGGLVDAAAAVIDFRNGATLGDQTPLTEFELHVYVSALDTASGNETYVLTLEVSDDSTFATGVAVKETITVTATGRYVRKGNNEEGGTIYRYARIKATLAGTTPSITYTAYLARP